MKNTTTATTYPAQVIVGEGGIQVKLMSVEHLAALSSSEKTYWDNRYNTRPQRMEEAIPVIIGAEEITAGLIKLHFLYVKDQVRFVAEMVVQPDIAPITLQGVFRGSSAYKLRHGFVAVPTPEFLETSDHILKKCLR